MRLVFIGTPDFAGDILESIIKYEETELAGIWTKPCRPAGRGQKIRKSKLVLLAEQNNIPLHQPEKANSDESIAEMQSAQADAALVIAFGQILKPNFYELPRFGTFNLHFSLLPAYRGASPLQTAVLNGDKITGLTIQKINQKMDEGDISMSTEFSIEGLPIDRVYEKAVDHSCSLVRDFLKQAPGSFTQLTPQDHSQATYCSKIHKDSGLVHGGLTVDTFMNMSRAYAGWPRTYFRCDGIKHDIMKCRPAADTVSAPAGKLVLAEKNHLYLGLKDGAVEIVRIKRENKKEMDVTAFLNGCALDFPAETDGPA